MFLQLVLCAVIGVYGVNGQLFSGCSKDILKEIETCISNSADFSSLEPSTLVSFFTNPTEAFCSKKTQLISLTACIYNTVLKCYDDSFKTLFPTNEMNEKTVNYLCDRFNSYNVTCLVKAIAESASCFTQGLNDLSSNPTYDEFKSYVCGSQKNTKNCIEDSKKFNECPETKKTLLELSKIQNPEACGGETGFESEVFGSAPTMYQSVVLLITISLMMFIF
ncbi:hypothetical protein LOTGIDRAFT_235865 [Lottia gigantea]|uniref:DUF19 domain-containing protein n=1 Tax=Lottia gigantea TaxID=225164 RepID=V3Z3K0_LOTGI|nr:hypothetical protein LOTGIDRAFT_235865 [Lottia gigantea]ESO85208.1 hypothetical protein LOTGIDRAFT_235865 [Lottia gigantea]